ncbi:MULTISPECIES: AAA family ATPase [Weeksellaceae]|nr:MULTISPECIES: AAA family ATPase [Weeksellaceae]MDH2208614.1 AAA family ATPase [Empedobacter sp. GD03644]
MNLDIEKNLIPINKSVFNIRTLNQCIQDGAKQPDLEYIIDRLIEEGIGVYFAKSNQGKTTLGVQMLDDIALGRNSIANLRTNKRTCLYIDCEMDDRQIKNRYTDKDGNHKQFSENFYRATLTINILEKDFLKNLIQSIKRSVLEYNIDFLLIDNLMTIIYDLNKPNLVLEFMLGLKKLREETTISILIIAHPRKEIDLNQEMDQNDIFGSSYIGNFLDYVIGMRRSRSNPKQVILRLLKTRMDENHFNSENVLVLELQNKNGIPVFEFIKFDSETNHLNNIGTDFIKSDEKMVSELDIIKKCKTLGIANTTIAKILSISEKTVRNKLKLLEIDSQQLMLKSE